LRVTINPDDATYELVGGEPLDLLHHGEPMKINSDAPVTVSYPDAPTVSPVEPPPGREAGRRGVGSDGTEDGMADRQTRQ
jgi:alpha,alpha-trehalose phosphorylase